MQSSQPCSSDELVCSRNTFSQHTIPHRLVAALMAHLTERKIQLQSTFSHWQAEKEN